MEVTADHPVYVEDEGWIWAENLEAGDELLDLGVDALRLADDVMDAGRAMARQGDELLEVAARHGDDVMDSHLIVRRLDEYVARTDESFTYSRRAEELNRTLDDGVSYSIAHEPSTSNFNANQIPDLDALNQGIYKRLAETPTGGHILEQIDRIGERPIIMFSDELLGTNRVGSYFPKENVIKLNPELQGLPEESLQATVAHELTHRVHRQMAGSQASEVLAHFVEGQVWEELGGTKAFQKLDTSQFTDFQKSILRSQNEISQIKTVEEMYVYINTLEYRALPNYNISKVEHHQNELQRWERNREFMAQHGNPNAFAERIKEVQEDIKFWKSFEE